MPLRLPVRLQRHDLGREAAFIDGGWLHSSRSIQVLNPADGETIGAVPNLGGKEARLAIDAAQRAQRPWSNLCSSERGSRLSRWHDLVLDHRADLAVIISAEQGKPLREAADEVEYAASFLSWFAAEAQRTYGDVIPGPSRKRLFVTKQAVGVVAAITPWNFPLAMVTRKAGAAIAAGCAMVLKPSDLTPFSALALTVLAEQAGIPSGVFNVITGDAPPIGEALLSDERVAKLSFTGSTSVGKALAARCMMTMKRVSLELGGNAPFIVFKDADIDRAIEGLILAKFRNAGQACVSANRILVDNEIYPVFASKLASRVSTLTLGAAFDGAYDLGPMINENACLKVEAHIKDALDRGAKLLLDRPERRGNFMSPALLGEVARDALLCVEETFGPLLPLIKFSSEADAIQLANHSKAGLAAYIFTNDLSRAQRVTEALEYGMVGLNSGSVSLASAPFGGIKESGFGREGSKFGIDEYLNLKLICSELVS